MKKVPFWRNPRLRYGGFSTLLLCVALAALVALNLVFTDLEKKNGWRADFSFNGLTTQSETTREVLASLAYPVHIYALYQKGSEDLPLFELLDRYAAASDLVTWEQADVALNPGLLTRFQSKVTGESLTNDSLVVFCEATGRWKALSYQDFLTLSLNLEAGAYEVSGLSYESRITSAIAYVTRDEIPRVIAVQGHGELDEAATGVLAELLTNNYFDVQYGRLGEVTPEPGDLVMLLSPVKDLTDGELEMLAAFEEAGGSFLFTCDYSDPVASMPNYAALLRSFGFLPKEGVVVASASEPGTYYDNMRINLIPYMLAGEITSDLAGGYNTLLLPGCRAFETPGQTDGGLIVTPLLSSGYGAYLHDVGSASLSLDQREGDEVGPFALALEATRVTGSGEVSRAFVLGSSALLTSEQIHAMTDAEEFILRTAQFLLHAQPTDLGIMAKAAVRPALSARSYGLGSLMLVALPLAVLAAAVVILLPRRNR